MIRVISAVGRVCAFDSDVISSEHHDLQQQDELTKYSNLRHVDFETI